MTPLLDRAVERAQLSLVVDDDPFADGGGDPDGLRWYQREMYDAVHAQLATVRSTLVVAATGTGKTRLFAAIAKHWPGRVLFLAHRDELVAQARREVERATEEWVEIEKADMHCGPHTRLVVGSVQTLCKLKRLETLGPDRFDLVIVDEGHHAVSPSYKAIMAYFAQAKVLLVTATPDRGDKKAMGQVAQTVAHTFTIEDGIDHGYLVPVRGQLVEVKEISLEGITKTAGDLAANQLDEMMLKAVEGVVKETIRLEPDRQGICFFPGIKSAELACVRFNELRPGSAIFIHANTDEDERKLLVRNFRKGDHQYFCNVGIATEGFDAPAVSLIVLARPTLSRALYTQMVGRGTRPIGGLIDHVEGKGLAKLRRGLIAKSVKPDCMVLDFVGNSGKHSLVSLVDILGGSYTELEIKKAKKKEQEEPGANPRDLLEQARKEIQSIARQIKSKVVASTRTFDPFKVMHMAAPMNVQAAGYKPLTIGLRHALLNYGLKEPELKGMSKADGDRFVQAQRVRSKAGLCTYKQLKQLQRFGVNEVNVPFERASAAMQYLSDKGFGRLGAIDPHKLNAIINHRREPGEEG